MLFRHGRVFQNVFLPLVNKTIQIIFLFVDAL